MGSRSTIEETLNEVPEMKKKKNEIKSNMFYWQTSVCLSVSFLL